MSNNFENDPALAQALANCTSAEEIKEATKQWMESRGMIARQPGNPTSVEVVGESQQHSPWAQPVMPASSGSGAYRVIYPHGNDRYELYGADEKELDAKEAVIRGMYRGR